jgi:uncharacterized membrane protein
MRNRIVGIIIVAFAVVVGVMTYLFNRALRDIVNTSCSMGDTCPMWTPVKFNTNINIGIMIAVLLLGLYLIIFSKEDTIESVPKNHVRKNMTTGLDADERLVVQKIMDSEGTLFQSDLVEQSGFTKVKVTRILDKLEGRGVIERRRRGMTNVVILKH